MNLEENGVVVVEYSHYINVAGGKGPVLKTRL